ncbi:MAG: SMC-Scp complex subunit ScpB [candidate division Zixibacteria bacterium]|nr:SMC-Scp complex subunit ScpB [candidate division Zixibacteria bacterium]
MNQPTDKLSVLEALLFAAEEPLPADDILTLCGDFSGEEEVVKAVSALNKSYSEAGRAFKIRTVAGGYQLSTLPKFAPYVSALVSKTRTQKLSRAALETLSIVAYRQPVSKPVIEKLRGVESSGVLSTLLERRLVAIVGREEGLGRPLLFGTTPEFLSYFGLLDLAALPKPEEIGPLPSAGAARPPGGVVQPAGAT